MTTNDPNAKHPDNVMHQTSRPSPAAMQLVPVDPAPTYIESSGRWKWQLPKRACFPGCCTDVVTASREWWEYAPSEAKPHPMAEAVQLRDSKWYWTVPASLSPQAPMSDKEAYLKSIYDAQTQRSHTDAQVDLTEPLKQLLGAAILRLQALGEKSFTLPPWTAPSTPAAPDDRVDDGLRGPADLAVSSTVAPLELGKEWAIRNGSRFPDEHAAEIIRCIDLKVALAGLPVNAEASGKSRKALIGGNDLVVQAEDEQFDRAINALAVGQAGPSEDSGSHKGSPTTVGAPKII